MTRVRRCDEIAAQTGHLHFHGGFPGAIAERLCQKTFYKNNHRIIPPMKDFEMTPIRTLVIFAVAAACLSYNAPAAHADSTGMASMHAWKYVGNKTCFVDHTHTGSSTGQKNKKAALAEAIKSWQEFTAFEYGTDWAYFKNAIAKGNSCDNDSSGYSCIVEARPCARGRRK